MHETKEETTRKMARYKDRLIWRHTSDNSRTPAMSNVNFKVKMPIKESAKVNVTITYVVPTRFQTGKRREESEVSGDKLKQSSQ